MEESKLAVSEKNKLQFLVLLIGDSRFCLDIDIITEIVLKKNITFVPKVSKSCIGIMNLRGDIIPIVDINYNINNEFLTISSNSCIVVIRYEEYYIGVIVDSVSDVIDVRVDDIIYYEEDRNYIGFINIEGEKYVIVNYIKVLGLPKKE